MFPITPAPVRSNSYTKRPSGGGLELFSSESEAVLSWEGRHLIHFESSVKVAGEEVLDWVDRGLVSELISLESVRGNSGMRIMVRETTPVYTGTRFVREQSNRSLLLNPQWFSVYFISFWEPLLREAGTGNSPAVSEILEKLSVLFEPGKAVADYRNHRIYIRRFLGVPVRRTDPR